MLKGETIICVSTTSWFSIWRNRQQVMSRLAHSNRICFIEPQSILSLDVIRNCKELLKFTKIKSTRLSDNLTIYYPPPAFPLFVRFLPAAVLYFLTPFIVRINNIILQQFIKKVVRAAGLEKPILWMYCPLDRFVIEGLKRKLFVYYVHDDIAQYPQNIKVCKIIERYESELCSKADIVITSSSAQRENRLQYNKETYLVQNAVDFVHFNKATDFSTQIPDDVKVIPHPIIGFSGFLGFHIDVNLLVEIAQSHPEWSLLLIGPDLLTRNSSYFTLKKLSNVYFAGEKRVADLPGYFKAFDIGIMPYSMDSHVATSFPLKCYEYMAAGLPSVSVNLPLLKDLRENVKLAESHAQFISHIEEILSGKIVIPISEGMKKASDNTWDNRLRDIDQLITKILNPQERKFSIIHFLDQEFKRDHRRANIDGLSNYARIICIEPPVTMLSLVTQIQVSINALFNRKIRKMSARNIFFFRPFMPFPYAIAYRWSLLERINRWFLTISLKRVENEIDKDVKVVFITCPQQSCAVKSLQEDLLCYDILDAYAKRPWLTAMAKRCTAKKETELLRQSQIVFATSYELYQQNVIVNQNTFYIPNTADTSLFKKANDSDVPIPDDLSKVPGPRVGLIGYINELVDIDLLNYLAERNHGWSIVIIGAINGGRKFRNSPQVLRLKNQKNIYFLGYKTYEMVPIYQKWLDVCLICYKINDYSDCIHPNKLLQYLSQYKEIVTTGIKEMRYVNQLVRVAGTYDEFEEAIGKALKGSEPYAAGSVIEQYLYDNSAEKLMEKKSIIIAGYIAERSL